MKNRLGVDERLRLGDAYTRVDGIVMSFGRAGKDEQVAEAFLLLFENTADEHLVSVVGHAIGCFNPADPSSLKDYDYPIPWTEEKEVKCWAKYNSKHAVLSQEVISQSNGNTEAAARMIIKALEGMENRDERICFLETVLYAGLCPYNFPAC